jgi:Protein of unknown function (DUF2001).
MSIILQDIPAGRDGTGYMSLNGTIDEAFKIKIIKPKTEFTMQNQQFLGSNIEDNAVRGMKITGDLTYYNTSSKLKEAIRRYKNGGSYPDITIQYYSESAALGREEITLTGVKLATVPLGGLDDTSSDATVQESTFTANNFDFAEKFDS